MTNHTVEIKVPSVGESVTEVEIGDWLKQEGDAVQKDENLVVLETDKATVELPSPVTGRLAKVLKRKGDRVDVGDVLGHVQAGEAATAPPADADKPAVPAAEAEKAAAPVKAKEEARPAPKPPPLPAHTKPPPPIPEKETAARVMPAAQRLMAEKGLRPEHVQPTGPGGRILKEDVQRASARPAEPEAESASAPAAAPPPAAPAPLEGDRAEEVVPMSLLRRKIAERLVRAQQEAALLTTFNEIDMAAVIAARKEHQEQFQERYQIKLGFMSFFVKAVVAALQETPQLNAEIRGPNIVFRNYFDIGIAIGGGKGLVVPVLRHAERMSFAEIEMAIADFAQRAKENKIKPEDLQGGTFTITNGGVYGSLLSTPIINPPQSGVLGMHTIQERPVAVGGQVVIRPMMYVALTYDHRVVDGREAVTFLRRVKECVENPVRLLLEV